MPQDRLQPSLLDRITDLNPEAKSEPSDQRYLNSRQLRAAIVRDLGWLLNTGRLEATTPLDGYPAVARSVLNYGIPELSGTLLSNVNITMLERSVRSAIIDFEPRIRRHSLTVRVLVDEDANARNMLTFEIEAEAWGYPGPLHFLLKTEMDLEHGHVSIVDFGG
ncbi:MAG: type VI secretion system baseplate subunit TssE [Pseudomonadota bacterium]